MWFDVWFDVVFGIRFFRLLTVEHCPCAIAGTNALNNSLVCNGERLTIYFARLKAGGNQLSLSMDIDLRHPAGLWREKLVMGDVFGGTFLVRL